ncbi:MAG: P63C domain-containing protein [Acidaminococcaceae bacterium]|nr:P63C domain-containing protein [Acidaminococcaceae bacterium]
MTKEETLPFAKYTGKLPIGTLELDCAVLDNNERILTAKSIFDAFGRSRKGMNNRLEIDGTKLPPFIAAKNLEPYISPKFLARTKPISYMDGSTVKTGYLATILPSICDIYLEARRNNSLVRSQQKIALQAEILLSALADVGIDALVDEATGFQYDRKHDALRILLQKYLAEGLQNWLLTFPDSFFAELDRLYNNEKTISRSRPMYYGKFINKYIYEPIEYGYVKEELNKQNIDPKTKKRKARFHQWLSNDGRSVLILQIGRVQGVMELCSDISKFKSVIKEQQELSMSPSLFKDVDTLL